MTEYPYTRVAVPVTFTKPPTVTRWVWFWQVGWFKTHGWAVKDRTLLKVQVEREMRLDDYIYGDDAEPMGLAKLYSDGTATGLGGIARSPDSLWRNRSA